MRPAFTLPLSVVAGLVTGYLLSRTYFSPAANGTIIASVDEAEKSSAAQFQSARNADGKAKQLIAAATRKGASNERENDMYLAIEAFTAEDFRALVGDTNKFKELISELKGVDWMTGRNLLSELVRRWRELDPAALTAWASTAIDLFPKEEPARAWILSELTSSMPEEMLALVPSRKDTSEKSNIIRQALEKLAAKDPAKARAWLDNCSDPKEREQAEKAYRLGIVESDPLRAMEMVESIKNRFDAESFLSSAASSAAKMGPGVLRQLANMPMKPWMVVAVIPRLAEHDPDAALELALKSGKRDTGINSSVSIAFAALTKRDPRQSLEKLEGLEGPDLASAVSAIGYTWAGLEPAAALTWLMQRPAAERSSFHIQWSGNSDTLVQGFSAWMENSPAEAQAWADALPAGETRDALQSEIVRGLAARGEPEAAIHALDRSGKAGDPKAIAQIASAWARKDPEAAANWAINQSPGPAQSRALAGIVGTWANDNQQGVEEWLAQFPPGEARDRSIKAFLWRSSAWTTTHEQRIAEFDAWFGLIDDPWERALVARSSFLNRRYRDPAAARAWLSSVQNVDPEIIRATLRDNAE